MKQRQKKEQKELLKLRVKGAGVGTVWTLVDRSDNRKLVLRHGDRTMTMPLREMRKRLVLLSDEELPAAKEAIA